VELPRVGRDDQRRLKPSRLGPLPAAISGTPVISEKRNVLLLAAAQVLFQTASVHSV
jgi:hypothetical protein